MENQNDVLSRCEMIDALYPETIHKISVDRGKTPLEISGSGLLFALSFSTTSDYSYRFRNIKVTVDDKTYDAFQFSISDSLYTEYYGGDGSVENVYAGFTNSRKGNGENLEDQIVFDRPLRFEKGIVVSAPASYEVQAYALVAFDRGAQS